MLISLSTFICHAPTHAEEILERWQAISQKQLNHIALAAHLSLAVQRDILAILPRIGLTCTELDHPFLGPENRPAASFISEDRDERAAAVKQLSASIQLAADHSVPRVVLYPQWLSLTIPTPRIVNLFMEDRPLDLSACAEERLDRGAAAFDRLCKVLDSALNTAQKHGIAVFWRGPSPWPHQVPNAEEMEQLRQIFWGAPLECCTCVDWIYLGAQLRQAPADFNQPSAVMQLADACGLVTNLPLGCGEIPWEDLLPIEESVREVVLTLAPLTRSEELEQGLALLLKGA